MFSDDDGLVPLNDYQFDSYALVQRITQKTNYGYINPRALVPSTGDDAPYNAWLTIEGPAGQNYCILNLVMLNGMLRECFRELYPAFRNAYPTPDLSFD